MGKNELKIGATYSSGAKAGIQLQFNHNDYLGEVVFWCDNGNENDLKANNCGEWESYPLAKERAKKIVESYNKYDKLKEENTLLIKALEDMIKMYGRERGLLEINSLHPEYSKAKELLNNLKK